MVFELTELDRWSSKAEVTNKPHRRLIKLFHGGLIEATELSELLGGLAKTPSQSEVKKTLDKLGVRDFVVSPEYQTPEAKKIIYRKHRGVCGWMRLENPEASLYSFRFEESYSLLDFREFLMSRTVMQIGVVNDDETGTISEDNFSLVIPYTRERSLADQIRERGLTISNLAGGGFAIEGKATLCKASDNFKIRTECPEVQYYLFANI